MNIRRATENDIVQLTELKNPQKEKHREMFHANQLKRLAEMSKDEVIYLVAEEDGQIIAHVLLKMYGIASEPDCPNINDVYVVEGKRNQGVGTKLLHEAERIAKEKGYQKISLAVNPTLNPKAKALYERLGYQQTKTKPYLDGVYDGDEDWVVDMVKEL
jgi:GNAT superfamily N-acetyltransferase